MDETPGATGAQVKYEKDLEWKGHGPDQSWIPCCWTSLGDRKMNVIFNYYLWISGYVQANIILNNTDLKILCKNI